MKAIYKKFALGLGAITLLGVLGSAYTYASTTMANRQGLDATWGELDELTDEQEDELLWMREEEKLARDIYLAFYEMYGFRIFSNIASSEQKHMDAIDQLLDTYGLSDPVDGNLQGEFEDQNLQDLYDLLLAQGSRSLQDALEVGVLIEETDIEDLEEAIAHLPAGSDIARVYSNLLRGSENHLHAFTRTLEKSRDGSSLQVWSNSVQNRMNGNGPINGINGRGRNR